MKKKKKLYKLCFCIKKLKKASLQIFIFHLFTCDFYIIINYNLNYTYINDYKIHKYMALLKACVFTDSIVYNINITRNIHK